jgi:sugar lactone lactonase YvrE/DNA-binding IclR family transcriptional regulator
MEQIGASNMTEPEKPKTVRGTAALAKGIALLNVVGEAQKAMRFSEIVKAAGMPKGTVHRLLAALVEHRLLRYDSSSQTYKLGLRLFELANMVWDDFDLRYAADPEVVRLRDMTGETIRLVILDGTEVVYIDQKGSKEELSVRYAVGTRVPVYCSAAGKAILSFLEPDKQAGFLSQLNLKPLTPRTITDASELKAQLDLTEVRGYAIDNEEQIIGLRSVSAPVLNRWGRPMAAVTITGPTHRLSMDKLHSYGRDLIEACRRIAGNAGESAVTLNTGPRPVGASPPDIECVFESTSFLGEGPLWSAREKRLYWVDILAPAIHRFDPFIKENQTVKLTEMVGAVAAREKGGLLAATQFGLKTFDFETGDMEVIADPESHLPENRFNDGKCDRAGRFWAGTLCLHAGTGIGSLYRLDPDRRVKQMDTGFGVSNGIGWDPDNRFMYFTDSKSRRIFVYDFDLASGEVENRRLFAVVPEGCGQPGGLTVDSQGFVWSVNWDGWCITRYDPKGEIERSIRLPVPRPTSCMFGGANLDILYVTSARIRLSAQRLSEAPLSGSIFAIDVGVKGMPEPGFGG